MRERAAAYRRQGAQVRVVAISDPRRGVLRTPAKYLWLMMRSFAAGLPFRPDIVESHYLVPTAVVGWATARLTRRSYVLYAHGSDAALDQPPWIRSALKRAIDGASEVHTNSDWTAGLLRDTFGVEAVVLPPGVDLTVFHPPEKAGGRAATVAFAGNLTSHKGVDVLLRALARIPDDIAWTATLAGDGPERSHLQALAAESGLAGRIRWLGEVDHETVADLFRKAAVVAVPSRRDALGLVALEALACGTPVVVSDVGGLGAIPTPGCGSVVPPDDPGELAEQLAVRLRHPGDRNVARAAVERASEFSADALAANALERLESVVALR
ncbi:MAG: glycosyltransferase family 4 protein [Actinobacteria bacterium]|nr:glycosyltransferase family 4 protein [Actinomycetota bacterium]